MHITLICPTYYDVNNNLFKTNIATLPPLSVFYVAGLVPSQHTVNVIDESVDNIDFEAKTDLVGISSTSVNIRRAYEISKEYKRRNIPVVLGGIHAFLEKEEALEHVDSVVIGEAEDSWPQAIIDAQKNKLNKEYQFPARQSIENLPMPRYDLINSSKYLKFLFRKSPLIPIQTARGCPHDCSFCSVTKFWGASMRFRPIKEVVNEISYSKGDTFFFTDDNFLSNPKRAFELCKELSKLNIKFICQIDSIFSKSREKILDALSEAGCVMVYVGLESIEPSRLSTFNKKFNKPEKYAELIKALQKRGINTYASLILGLEGDNQNTVNNTIEFLTKCKVEMAAFFPITPFPGTTLYNSLKEKKQLSDEQWWLHLGQPGSNNLVNFPTNKYTECELSEMANKRFFTYSSILKRLVRFKRNLLIPIILNLAAKKRLKISGGTNKL